VIGETRLAATLDEASLVSKMKRYGKLIASCFPSFHAEAAKHYCRTQPLPLADYQSRWPQPRSEREHGGMLAASTGAATLAVGNARLENGWSLISWAFLKSRCC